MWINVFCLCCVILYDMMGIVLGFVKDFIIVTDILQIKLSYQDKKLFLPQFECQLEDLLACFSI